MEKGIILIMKIVKNYYDVMLQEAELIQSELDFEKAVCSKTETEKQREQSFEEAEHIIQLATEEKKRTWHVYDQKKADTFHMLYEQALLFAKENAINILIDTTPTTGRILLKTPFLYDGVLLSVSNKPTLLKLIACADSFILNARDDMMEFDFYYHFTTEKERPAR